MQNGYVPATSTPQKKISRRIQTINTSPMMVPTAIPAMAPGVKPGRVVVTGGVAVREEAQFQYTLPLGILENVEHCGGEPEQAANTHMNRLSFTLK